MPELCNAAQWLVDRHVEAGDGDRAVRAPSGPLTYAELAASVRRVAAGLRALGVRPEERVLLVMVDEVELLAAILAVLRIGAVAVPSSTMLTGPELATLTADARARVVLGSAEFADGPGRRGCARRHAPGAHRRRGRRPARRRARPDLDRAARRRHRRPTARTRPGPQGAVPDLRGVRRAGACRW